MTGLLGPALCLGMVPFMGCSHLLAMTFLVTGMTLYGFTVGGQTPTALDIAPDFAGMQHLLVPEAHIVHVSCFDRDHPGKPQATALIFEA